MLPAAQLDTAARAALVAVCGEVAAEVDPQLRRAQERRFGHYQVNAVMGLARQVGRDPRTLATEVAARLKAELGPADDGVLASAEVAGPGFINLTVADTELGRAVDELAADPRLGVPGAEEPQRVVVDYSAPNVAKEMHVGHLRSTIIGDALARLHAFLGHEVVAQNHLGDWGTPFGMLIEHLLDVGTEAGVAALGQGELTGFYQQARHKFDHEPGFADRARQRVVALQAGDEPTLDLWRLLSEGSRRYFTSVYERLGVRLTDGDVVAESAYNDQLDEVVAELEARGLLRVSDGALCAYPPGFTGRDGAPLPLLVRKADGGYGYQATDLAAVRHRVQTLGADRILYVVGAPQTQHLDLVFAVAGQAGWLDGVEVEHVEFGTVLGEDGRKMASRAGESVKLIDLLAEATTRARAVAAEKNPDLSDDELDRLGAEIGIGAVKYADLAADRVKDYTFAWSRLLALQGNTAPYLQYAHARICSIFRRADRALDSAMGPVVVTEPDERELVLHLADFGPRVATCAATSQPHHLCGYLFELAQTFSRFYQECPVLGAPTPEAVESRLTLAAVTARTLTTGLDLLGITAPDRM